MEIMLTAKMRYGISITDLFLSSNDDVNFKIKLLKYFNP